MDRDQEIERDVIGGTEATDHDPGFDRPGDRASSVRDDIRSAIRETEDNDYERKPYDDVEAPQEDQPKERKTRRTRDTLATEAVAAAEGDQGDQADDTTPEPETRQQPGQGQDEPPTSWTKEAKAEWKKAPARIKQEVLKREADIQRGVQQLQQRYGEIDQAIAPYQEAVRQFGKTPGQAVAQLFGWFDVLAKNPDAGFPALLRSYKYDPRRLLQAFGYSPNALANAPRQQPQQAQIHPALQQYLQQQQQQLQGLTQWKSQYEAQQQAVQLENTERMLNAWASDKPHFQEVRGLMGHLLTPDATGRAPVPLAADGTVDLDAAYEMATNAIVAPRERQAAQNYREKAQRARRASTSLRPSTPGFDGPRRLNGGKQAPRDVRASIKDAIAELSDR